MLSKHIGEQTLNSLVINLNRPFYNEQVRWNTRNPKCLDIIMYKER